jgi:hypothetical protein
VVEKVRDVKHSVCKTQIALLKVKAIPSQDWTAPEDSRRLRFPDFKTIGTWRW